MKYDFDKILPRESTDSIKWEYRSTPKGAIKWDATSASKGADRVLPMWVADMDFECAPAIIAAFKARIEHPIFGYTGKSDEYYGAVTNWMKSRHNWDIKPEWISTSPGVVPALAMLIRVFSDKGNAVLVQRPVYYPFMRSIEANGRSVVSNSLVLENGGYHIDFDDLEKKAANPKVTMAILCNPHNPVGRIWRPDELRQIGEILISNGVTVISDEIHCDLIMKGHTFTPFASISDEFAQNSVTCTAPSKTFNLAGLHNSNLITPNRELKAKVDGEIGASGLFGISPFSAEATIAAYNESGDWLDKALEYIEGNYKFLSNYVSENIPELTVLPLEGTYLAWIDCRKLALDKDQLEDLMLNKAGIYFDEGYIFGEEGEGFERINLACPRSIVEDAAHRIAKVVSDLR